MIKKYITLTHNRYIILQKPKLNIIKKQTKHKVCLVRHIMKYKRSAYYTVAHKPQLNHPTLTIAPITQINEQL